MVNFCDTCKRALEEFYAWTDSSERKPILFHGKNMNNGFFECFDAEDRIKYQCIRTLIEQLAQDDEKENTQEATTSSCKKEDICCQESKTKKNE